MFNVHESVHLKNILIYAKQDATLHSLFYLETALHVSGGTICFKFNVHGSVHLKNILIYIQLDATLHSLFYLETALHVSGGTICFKFNVHGSVHRKNILIYVQQDATLHSLFYLETALHISGGTSTNHQERIQMYLQHLLFVTPLLPPAAIAAGGSNGLPNNRCCRYSCLRS